MIEKIISGGQTGVDLAGLDAAMELNIPHGGYCPKGRLYELGIIPKQYNLTETDSSSYEERTILNLTHSDGTLIFLSSDLDKIQDGTRLTIEELKKQDKPHLIINQETDSDPVKQWIIKNNIKVLNIAGPRESSSPGVYEKAKQFFLTLFPFLVLRIPFQIKK